MSTGIKVEVIAHHTFAGKDYAPGDTYVVSGDAHQTQDQYLDTLRALHFVKVPGEDGPNIVNEIGSPEQAAAPAQTDTAVQPMSTESNPKASSPRKSPKSAKAPKSGKGKK